MIAQHKNLGDKMNAIDKYRSMRDEKQKSEYMEKCLRFMTRETACALDRIFPIIPKENYLAEYCSIHQAFKNEPYIIHSEEDFRKLLEE